MINNFHVNLKNYRKEAELNQSQLADKLGITQSTVAGWEAKKSKPQFDVIMDLCDIFSCTPNDLILDHSLLQHTSVEVVEEVPEDNNYASILQSLIHEEEQIPLKVENHQRIKLIANKLIAENSGLKDKVIALYNKIDQLRGKVEKLL